MKSRWLLNLGLLVIVLGLGAFLYFHPKQEQQAEKSYELCDLKLSSFSNIQIDFPAKASVSFEKKEGFWYIKQPFSARADQIAVQRLMSIVAAKSTSKFPANDLTRFGLDQPKLKLKLDNEEFLFGTFNPVTSEQYVAYKGNVYLLSSSYSESAQMQVSEFIDKNPMRPKEEIVGFDFSNLEQWQDVRLNVDLVDGKWKASTEKAKPNQNEMNEWFDAYWRNMSVQEVEQYTPDHKATYPSFEVKLKDGKKVHFDKIQEAPELLLGRPDEGLLYHVANDIGFNLLNPPVNMGK